MFAATLLGALLVFTSDNDLIGNLSAQTVKSASNDLLDSNCCTDFKKQAPATPVYDAAYARAVKEDKPLVVWVGGNFCDRCVRDSKNEFVHHFAPDGWQGVRGPATVVYVPHGDQLYRAATVTRWTVGSHDWGHVPSARRAAAEWRAQANGGNTAPLTMLDFGDGGKWGMSDAMFWANYNGRGNGTYRGVPLNPAKGWQPVPARNTGATLFRSGSAGGNC